jgi:hypothetical protein
LIIFKTAVSLFGVYRRHSSLSSSYIFTGSLEKADRMSRSSRSVMEDVGHYYIAAIGPHIPNARVTVCRMLYRKWLTQEPQQQQRWVLLLHTTKVAGARLFCFAVADSRTALRNPFSAAPGPPG